jgi:hypothetical protein
MGIMPPSEETELLRQITDRKAPNRDRAAALLHGRDLSPKATQALVWQFRHRNPAYRKAAMDALWDSTISDAVAALVLAGQLEHRKPELRAVARQVLQNANINIRSIHRVEEYVESARRRSLDNSQNN